VLTALAILFVVVLLGSIAYGFSLVVRRPPTSAELNTERCTLCRRRFDKARLIEREVGDTRVFYFCNECITRLASDAEALRAANEISS
jgi:hypothetical protein